MLDIALGDAQRISSVGEAIKISAGAIHAIPRIHEIEAALGRIEFYVGRSTENNVIGRLKSHRTEKGHKFAAIVCLCDSDSVEIVEDVATFVVKYLNETGSLCCANLKTGGGATPRDNESGVIYLTWKIN